MKPIHFIAARLMATGIWLALAAGNLQAQVTPVPAPVQETPVLIKNVTVHVGNTTVLTGQDILLDKGKIAQLGPNLSAPAGTITLDGTGKHVYPGLIALNTTLGLVEIEAVRATDDLAETGVFNAAARSVVSYNTDSHIIPTVRSNGVLLAQVAPQGGGITGRSSLMQLDAWNWEDATVVADEGLHIVWPSTQTPWWAAEYPEFLERYRKEAEENMKLLRGVFDQAVAYAKAKETGQVTHTDPNLEAMMPFISGQKRIYIEADDLSQLETILTYVDRYRLKVAIKGGYHAPEIAPLLVSRGIPVILTDVHALPENTDDPVDLPFAMAKLLHDQGVQVCISVQGGWQQFNLAFHAGTAAAYGLSKEQALMMITKNPAEVLGVGDQLGTVEVGKDATILLVEGDVLDMRTSRVVEAFINGRRIDLDNKHKQLYRKWQEKYERMEE